jgi:isopentenyl-diphosphate delta-isomerase
MYRSQTYVQREVAASFRDWGIPTATNILQVRAIDEEIPLIGSGGIQTGIDIAKCIALGADISTLAGVILRAAAGGAEMLHDRIEILRRQFQIAMFVTGAPDVAALRDAPMTYDGGDVDR